MKNIDFLSKVIADNKHDYWIVARKPYTGETEIIFVSFPVSIRRGIDIKEMLFGEVEKIYDIEILTNIFLSNNYAPFQYGIRIGDFFDGFPVFDLNITYQEFLTKCLELNSKNLYDYKELSNKYQKINHE